MIKLIAFLDGSIYSKSVCEYAAWIAAKVGGSVDLVHVLGRRDESGAPVNLSGSLLSVTDASSKANKKLESAAALLRDAGYTVGTTVQAGQPEAVICEKIKTGQFDLLLMGAYGHSHIRNLIIGSTTTAMIRFCKIPVLLFR